MVFFSLTFRPKMDENKDPNESLMELMKKMYDEGDDEMKRTIAKAWTENRDKQMWWYMILCAFT